MPSMSSMSGPINPVRPPRIVPIRPRRMLFYICAPHHLKIHIQEGYIMEPSTDRNAIQSAGTDSIDCAPASPAPVPALSAQFAPAPKPSGWSAFAEGPAADFFTGYKLDKMTLDDGSGNKAKFSRTRDGSIKIEYTSSVLL